MRLVVRRLVVATMVVRRRRLEASLLRVVGALRPLIGRVGATAALAALAALAAHPAAAAALHRRRRLVLGAAVSLDEVLQRELGLADALRARARHELHVEAAPRRGVAEGDGANAAGEEEAERLDL